MTDIDPSRRTLLAMAGGALVVGALPSCSPGKSSKANSTKTNGTTDAKKELAMQTHFRTAKVDGLDIFYREAGPADAPTIVMLHGYPTSSRMYRDLIPTLSDRYHVIAPDYPAFGRSSVPSRATFKYTHEHLSEVVDALLAQLRIGKFGLYLMDFGGPIGYRIMLKHQDRFAGVVLQNTPAFGEETSPETWGPLLAYWKDGSEAHREAARFNTSAATIKDQYLNGVKDPTLIDPDSYTLDSLLIARPGVSDIMMDLLYDIRNNKATVAAAKTLLTAHQKQAIIVTGVNDPLFPGKSMQPPPDMSDIEFHGVDSGHFALEDKLPEMAPLIRAFYDRTLGD